MSDMVLNTTLQCADLLMSWSLQLKSEALICSCSAKQVFLKILRNLQENGS